MYSLFTTTIWVSFKKIKSHRGELKQFTSFMSLFRKKTLRLVSWLCPLVDGIILQLSSGNIASQKRTEFDVASFLLLLEDVFLIVEVTKEHYEGKNITKHHYVHRVWEVALGDQVVAGVKEEEEELQLQWQMGIQIRLNDTFCDCASDRSNSQKVLEQPTSCSIVRYFFHQRCFCMWGPNADRQ